MQEERFVVELELREGFAFAVDFGGPHLPDLLVDEPLPLGSGRGPNATRLLAAAIGNCLSASLLFCLSKSRVEVAGLRTTVEGSIVRNEAGRLRIAGVHVRLEPDIANGQPGRINRCLELFEDFCTVTASVRQGIEIDVEVELSNAGVVGAADDA